jgi:hypothetical protein
MAFVTLLLLIFLLSRWLVLSALLLLPALVAALVGALFVALVGTLIAVAGVALLAARLAVIAHLHSPV